MMQALILLKQQTGPRWPRWERGLVASEDGMVPHPRRHWFVLEPIPGVPLNLAGQPVPVCRFVNGATYVEIDRARLGDTAPAYDICDHCVAVSLEHALAELC